MGAVIPNWDLYARYRPIHAQSVFGMQSVLRGREGTALLAWYRHATKADWASPAEVKADFRTASILKDGRAVFTSQATKYRLVVGVNYAYRVVYIRFIGTHADYDKIDAQTI
jgi:mRNA interferase HigB